MEKPIESKSKAKRKRPWTISRRAKKLFQLSRLIHVYASTLFLGLLIFFCITGILINHTDWIDSDAKEGVVVKPLPAEALATLSSFDWAGSDNPPSTVAITGYLREEFGLKAPKEIKVDNEMKEITFDYQMPSSYVFVTASAEDQNLKLEHRSFGFWQVMGDLHKGRNSGPSWSWLIDISAVGMLIFSVTGLFILFQNLKYRRAGLILSALGLGLPVLIYYLLVPRFFGV